MLSWERNHSRTFPWRDQTDPYAVLVGEILLQRTRAEHAAKVYSHFIGCWPDPKSLGEASVVSLSDVLRPLGLPNRARLLKRLGQAVSAEGRVATDPARLLKLPGVGLYAANAVPIFARRRNLPLVDWVIARVLRRYFGLIEEGRPSADRELWRLADRLAAPGRARDLWLGTLDFAAAVCRSHPRCISCPLSASCCFARNDSARISARRQSTVVDSTCETAAGRTQ